DVGGEAHAVGHRHHHLAIDDGNRLKLVLEVPPPLFFGGGKPALLLRVDQRDGAARRNHRRNDDMTSDRLHTRIIRLSSKTKPASNANRSRVVTNPRPLNPSTDSVRACTVLQPERR